MTFFSAMIIPIIISIVLFIGLKEKKNVYDIFVDGAKEGIKITLKLFPTMIGIFWLYICLEVLVLLIFWLIFFLM